MNDSFCNFGGILSVAEGLLLMFGGNHSLWSLKDPVGPGMEARLPACRAQARPQDHLPGSFSKMSELLSMNLLTPRIHLQGKGDLGSSKSWYPPILPPQSLEALPLSLRHLTFLENVYTSLPATAESCAEEHSCDRESWARPGERAELAQL